MRVTLELEQGPAREITSRAQLRELLAALGGPGNGYAVLGSADEHYIQTTGSREHGFLIEFREGSEDAHYRSARKDIAHAEMVEILLAYYDAITTGTGEHAWQRRLEWAPPLTAKRRRAPRPAKKGGLVSYRNAIILLVLAALASLATWDGRKDTLELERNLVETQGKVLLAWHDANRSGWLHVTVRFYADGKPYVFKEDLSGITYHTGDMAPVVYNARKPAVQHMVREADEIWRDYYFDVVISTLLAASGAVILFLARRATPRRRTAKRKG